MKLGFVVSAVVCFSAIAACTPMQTRLQELDVPPQRIVQKGYSLMPPNENGWLIARRNQYQLDLVRRGANEDESIAIQAAPVRLPEFTSTEEFVRLVKEGQAKDTNPLRFAIKGHDVAAYSQKGNCVKSHLLTEDNAAVRRSKRSGVLILEALTLTCVHPKNKTVGINVTYSHRYDPKNEDPAFIGKATAVLDSMEFGEL